jgi:hypothetical protein
MDVQNKSYDLFGANRQLLPFEFHFKTLHSNTKMFLHNWVLHFARIPGICNLKFLDLQNISYEFCKFLPIWKCFKSIWIQAGHMAQNYWTVLLQLD